MNGRSRAGSDEPLRAAVAYPGDSKRERWERDLLERGVSLPLTHRTAWSSVDRTSATWFVAACERGGSCRFGAAVQVSRSHAVPGHLLLRVERLDPTIDPEGCAVVLRALSDLARRRWPRVLRAYVELYSLDADARERAADLLRDLGFRRADRLRMYRYTPVVDLSGDEDAVFSRMHRSARRNVRTVMKKGLEVRVIDDRRLGPRVDRLFREAFSRTGGTHPIVDWESIIELSSREPDLSRVAGLFRSNDAGPDSLLAFEWGSMHGTHAQSLAAGSTRAPDVGVPLAYALVWDLMCWARARGARYLDLGGVTHGTHGSGDPLGGVSDFKRAFGGTVVEVGDEWAFEPHPIAAGFARAVARGAALLTRLPPGAR